VNDDDDDTTTDSANQSTPVGAHHSRNRERRRPSLVDTHPDGAHYVADVSESTARRRESEYGVDARSGATVGKPSPINAGGGRNRHHLRDAATRRRRTAALRCDVDTASGRATLTDRVRSSRSGYSSRIAQPTTDGTMWTSWRI